MPQLSFVTLDVFTQDRYKGNPLAVVQVPQGSAISDDQMQMIAREFNLSETVFVQSRSEGDWRIRIFLTTAEVPFAGHPTIGAAVHVLGTVAGGASQGRLIANAGTIEARFEDRVATASIPHNFHEHIQYPFSLDDVYNLQPSLTGQVVSPAHVAVISPVKGMNFVAVELMNLGLLSKITSSSKPAPRLDEHDGWNVGFSASYYYVILGGLGDVTKVQARMIEGSFEDPATGSAACALSCYLALKRAESQTTQFQITQGVEMGRKSDIGVIVTLDEQLRSVEKVELSGSATKVMEGVLEI